MKKLKKDFSPLSRDSFEMTLKRFVISTNPALLDEEKSFLSVRKRFLSRPLKMDSFEMTVFQVLSLLPPGKEVYQIHYNQRYL